MSNNELPLEEQISLIDLIEGAQLNKQDEDIAAGKKFGYPLRPSSASKCARALAYELHEFEGHATYTPDIKTASVMRLLDLGHAVERDLINTMRRTGLMDIRYTQQVVTLCRLPSTGRLIEGSIDLAVFTANGMKILADVKTKGVKWNAGFDSSWTEDTKKYEKLRTLKQLGHDSYYAEDVEAFLEELNDSTIKSNIMQLNAYARTDFIVARGFQYGSILQYCKNDSKLREIRFKTSQALAEKVHAKFIRVADAIYGGQPPEAIDREEVLGSMACAFCRFKTNCWPEVDPKKAFFQTLPDKQWATDTSYLGDRGAQLEAVYAKYAEAARLKKSLDNCEQEMLKLMLPDEGRQVKKVRFSDGTILEARFLKTPFPGYQIRPGKVK